MNPDLLRVLGSHDPVCLCKGKGYMTSFLLHSQAVEVEGAAEPLHASMFLLCHLTLRLLGPHFYKKDLGWVVQDELETVPAQQHAPHLHLSQ